MSAADNKDVHSWLSQSQPLPPVDNEAEKDGNAYRTESPCEIEHTPPVAEGNGFCKMTERSPETEHPSTSAKCNGADKMRTEKTQRIRSSSMPAHRLEHIESSAVFRSRSSLRLNRAEEHIVSVDEQLVEEGRCSLRLCALAMLAYCLIGQAIGIHEGWSPIESFYFTVVTFTTVGYGDYCFGEEDSKWQLIGSLFILLGIIIFGVTWTTIFTRVFRADQHEVRAFAEYRAADKDQNISFEYLKILKLKRSVCSSHVRTWLRMKFSHPQPQPRWTDYSAAGALQSLEDQNLIQIKVSCAVALAKLLILVLGMTVVMKMFEGWSFETCLYWAVTTAATVGYGDVIPSTQGGRLLTTVLIISSVGLCSEALGVLASFRSVHFETRARHRVLSQFGTTLTQQQFNTLAHGDEMRHLGISAKDSEVTKAEFCLYMLMKLGRVSQEDLLACQAAFARLDLTHTGTLDYQDLAGHLEIRKSEGSSKSNAASLRSASL